jgi:hypothetical protein
MADDVKPGVATIREEVESILGNSRDTTRKQVVDHLVGEKLEERKKLVLTGMERLRSQRTEVSKLEGGGTEQFDVEGKSIGKIFTKQQTGDIKNAREKLVKIEAALEEALSKGEYKKLENCCKGKDAGGKSEES